MKCIRCEREVEGPRETYDNPVCFDCLPPPQMLSTVECHCWTCVQIRRQELQRKDANDRTRDRGKA
jgi:hypothetical protein